MINVSFAITAICFQWLQLHLLAFLVVFLILLLIY